METTSPIHREPDQGERASIRGQQRIFVVSASGGTPRRLTTGTLTEGDTSWSPDGRKIAFAFGGPAPESEARIAIVEVSTGRVTRLAGSEGFYSPRWSPDGRYIAALSRYTLHLVLFDLADGHRISLVSLGVQWAAISWPQWSVDGRSISFSSGEADGGFRRVTIADHRIEALERMGEVIARMGGIDYTIGRTGGWVGWMPDGSPMLLFDVGTHDIYALDWDAP